MKRKILLLSSVLLVAVMLIAVGGAQAASGYSEENDGAGNKVQIWSSYNQYGGTVNVAALAYYIGGSVGGVEIGVPIYYGETLTITIEGFVNGNLVYSNGYSYTSGWQYTKNVSFNLPGGLTEVNVVAHATYSSIFGNSEITCNLYS